MVQPRLCDLNGTSMLLEHAGDYHLDEHLKRGKDARCLLIFGEVLNALRHALSCSDTG